MNADSQKGYRLAATVAAIILTQVTVLYVFGQPPICTCGYVKLWEGVVKSAGNSQHLSDWYTFSHIIHGLAFYCILSIAFRKLPLGMRFAMAVGLEVSWEILENTPMVINHYRKQALAQGYVGDSIVNSLSDTASMCLGFLAAWRLPIPASIGAVLGMELFVGYAIRDNLALNILNLIHVFPSVAAWQAG